MIIIFCLDMKNLWMKGVNPVRNSSGALNPAGIILKSNPAAEQRGIISNGVNSPFLKHVSFYAFNDFYSSRKAYVRDVLDPNSGYQIYAMR